jgi:hypothetical protein
MKRALPSVGQLDDGLRLSPQRLRGHQALEINRLFPREHVIHGAAQLVGEHGQGFGFAGVVFELGKILFSWLTLTEEKHGSFRKGPRKGTLPSFLPDVPSRLPLDSLAHFTRRQ